jgi:hypothetical protein
MILNALDQDNLFYLPPKQFKYVRQKINVFSIANYLINKKFIYLLCHILKMLQQQTCSEWWLFREIKGYLMYPRVKLELSDYFTVT